MGLTNFDIIKLVQHLKIPNFKGVFMRDELPSAPQNQECGIVNFNKSTENDKIRSIKIGIIYQEKNLLNDFTTIENVYLPKLLLTNDKNQSLIEAKKIIKKVGLGARLDHYPSELSGGECQRVAISRAIINSPQIILADEPTGSLDFNNAKEIFKILFDLKIKDRMIIFATHNRYFANMADCKIEMIDGKMKITNARII